MKCVCRGCVARIGKASLALVCHGIRLLPKPKSSSCKSDRRQRSRRKTNRTTFIGLSVGFSKRRHNVIRNLGNESLIPRAPILVLNPNQFGNLSHGNDSVGIPHLRPILPNVSQICTAIFASGTCLNIVFVDLQTLVSRILYGFIQTSIHCVVSSKDGFHKMTARTHHIRQIRAHLSQHLSKMITAMRARDTSLKKIQPLRHKLLFLESWILGIQGGH